MASRVSTSHNYTRELSVHSPKHAGCLTRTTRHMAGGMNDAVLVHMVACVSCSIPQLLWYVWQPRSFQMGQCIGFV